MKVKFKNGSVIEDKYNIKDSMRSKRSKLIFGSWYKENETGLIWRLVDCIYQEVELENYNTTYVLTIDEFLSDFTYIGQKDL